MRDCSMIHDSVNVPFIDDPALSTDDISRFKSQCISISGYDGKDSCLNNSKSLPWRVLDRLLVNVFVLTLLAAYTTMGAFLYTYLDEKIASQPFSEVFLFTFTSITTIGYGSIVPGNTNSQLFTCIYCLLGIPLSFTAFAKSGELISFAYWTVAAAWNRAEFDYELWHTAPFRMPMRAICLALTVHSAFGAVIFSYWIDDMEFVPALYFSFVSITTIGYGDLIPIPDNLLHTTVIIVYLCFGITVMSAMIGVLANHLQQLRRTRSG